MGKAPINYRQYALLLVFLYEYHILLKHIDGNLWEPRPLANRIFFFYWKDDKFVLVHHYIKKSQKAPKKELDIARKKIKDYLERNDK